jgi:phospholipid/cholesterol/gamma-HCH transport system ATP-binding protein
VVELCSDALKFNTSVLQNQMRVASIFTIGNNCVFANPDAKTMTARGDPKELLAHCPDTKVALFLRRGEKETA